MREAVRLTDGELGAVRIDSGDLTIVARQVRDLLDDLGATSTRVIVTSDLDEWQIAALRGVVRSTGTLSGKALAVASGAVPINPMTLERAVWIGRIPSSISMTSTPW